MIIQQLLHQLLLRRLHITQKYRRRHVAALISRITLFERQTDLPSFLPQQTLAVASEQVGDVGGEFAEGAVVRRAVAAEGG